MNRGDHQRIVHIKTYCEDIAGFIQRFGKDYQVFIQDRAYFNAVSMCIFQIGELANRLSDEFREETKDQLPWGMIRGMRNWLAHAYAEMDEEIIWETAINSIPVVLLCCAKVIEQDREEKNNSPLFSNGIKNTGGKILKEVFEAFIDRKLASIHGEYVDLISGAVHREVGGYPSNKHRMPVCCNVMYQKMKGDDEILASPPKGRGATLKIRYYKRNR